MSGWYRARKSGFGNGIKSGQQVGSKITTMPWTAQWSRVIKEEQVADHVKTTGVNELGHQKCDPHKSECYDLNVLQRTMIPRQAWRPP